MSVDSAYEQLDESAPAKDQAPLTKKQQEQFQHYIQDRELHAGLLKYALRLTQGHRADAEDLLQESWRKAFQKFSSFVENTNFGGWLATIVHNLHISQERRKSLERDSEPEFQYIQTIDRHIRTVEEQAGDSEWFSILTDAIARLSPERRQVCELCYINDMTTVEIAEILGIPQNTVATRLSRARHDILVLLSEERPGIDADVADRTLRAAKRTKKDVPAETEGISE